MRDKVDIGIYIGNEYSSIARMENGEPLVIKSAVLKDSIPTCIYINKKGAIQVGDTAYSAMKSDNLKTLHNFDTSTSSSFVGFLRTVGTDKKYYSSNLEKDFSSEELIAEIIKALKSFISDEEVKSAVITIPAKFTINQKDAIRRAGELAGLKQVELLQEPIATSMAYGLDTKSKDGFWLVFDFGGGTFDAALLKVEEGIMKVIDTEGDNYLGGKNLDYAIVDEIIIPHIQENFVIDNILADDKKKKYLQDSLTFYAEETIKQMSFNDSYNIFSDLGEFPDVDDEGEEFELDITITQEMMQSTLGPFFQKAIDLCKDLLERNNLKGNLLDSLIPVGGPTYSPILRKMLEGQITKPNVSIDPITAIVKGAALYASTVYVSDDIREQQRDKTKIQLEFGYEATTVEEEEFVTVKILKDKTEGAIPNKVFVEIVRSDKTWSSGKTEIDEKGNIIEVKLDTKKGNTFNVLAYNEQGNLLPSEPSSFTITHTTYFASTTLPYNIGIEIKSRASGKVVFRSIKGLEKNQSTPAIGTIQGLKTQKDAYPGSKDIVLKIPLYQGEHGAEGTRAIYNEHVYDIIISGEDLPNFLPKGSDIDITIKVDKSERISLSAYFPALDYSHDIEVSVGIAKDINADWLESEINKAQQTLSLIKQEGFYSNQGELDKLDSDISETKKHSEQGKGDYDRKKDVLDRLRRILIKLDSIYDGIKRPRPVGRVNRKDEILLEIDSLKTKLINNFEDNEVLTKDIFTSLFDGLFDLGKEIEQNNTPIKQLIQNFEEIKVKVEQVLG